MLGAGGTGSNNKQVEDGDRVNFEVLSLNEVTQAVSEFEAVLFWKSHVVGSWQLQRRTWSVDRTMKYFTAPRGSSDVVLLKMRQFIQRQVRERNERVVAQDRARGLRGDGTTANDTLQDGEAPAAPRCQRPGKSQPNTHA